MTAVRFVLPWLDMEDQQINMTQEDKDVTVDEEVEIVTVKIEAEIEIIETVIMIGAGPPLEEGCYFFDLALLKDKTNKGCFNKLRI